MNRQANGTVRRCNAAPLIAPMRVPERLVALARDIFSKVGRPLFDGASRVVDRTPKLCNFAFATSRKRWRVRTNWRPRARCSGTMLLRCPWRTPRPGAVGMNAAIQWVRRTHRCRSYIDIGDHLVDDGCARFA